MRNRFSLTPSATSSPTDSASRTGNWGPLGGAGFPVEGDLLDDVGGHSGRAQAGDADAARPQGEGEGLGESDDGVLRRRVRKTVVSVGQQACCGGGVDHVSEPLLQEQRQEHEVAAYDAQQVHVDDALPRFERDVLDGADGQDADVVHHQVDLPEPLQREVPYGTQVVEAGDIARGGDSTRTVRPQLGGDRLCPFGVQVGDHHPRAPAGEGMRGGSPDPAALRPVTTVTASRRSIVIELPLMYRRLVKVKWCEGLGVDG